MEIRRALVTDKRSVSIDVADVPEHRTRGGRTPIAPNRLTIEMWVSPWHPDVLTTYVEINGRRLEDLKPRQGQYLRRRMPIEDAPEWVRELAKQHRPAWAPPEARP